MQKKKFHNKCRVHNRATHKSLGKTFPRRGIVAALYMNEKQKHRFANDAGKCRFVYNNILSRHNKYYNLLIDAQEEAKFLAECEYEFKGEPVPDEITIDPKLVEISGTNEHAFKLILNDLIKEYPWLKDTNQKVLFGAVRNLLKAFDNFFSHPEKFNYPKPKKKKSSKDSCSFNSQCFSGIYGNRINLTTDYKDMRFDCSKRDMKYLNRYQDYIQTTTISKTKSGKFFISFGCGDFEINQKYQKQRIPDSIEKYAAGLKNQDDTIIVYSDNDEEIGTYLQVTDKETGEITFKKAKGFDLGIKDKLITSDGEKIANNRYLKNAHKKLEHLQRMFSKKQKKSSAYNGMNDFEIEKNSPNAGRNREKARLRLAKEHEKVANIRESENKSVAADLLMNNDILFGEDLNISGMLKNHKLAAAIADAGWGQITEILEQNAVRYGRTFIKVGRFYPSSRKCPHCGNTNKDLKLSDRAWVCPHCSHIIDDRDINAAQNILEEGIRIYRE